MHSVKNFLKNHKKIVIAVLIPVVLFVIAVFVIATKETLNKRREHREFDRKTKEMQEALEKPYREDIYGGKTPEETWGLFLNALRADNIDLASKYFYVDWQEKNKKFLLDLKNENDLNLYLKQISVPLIKDTEIPDFLKHNSERAYYYYIIKQSDGKYRNDVNFYFNPYTKIWKILVL